MRTRHPSVFHAADGAAGKRGAPFVVLCPGEDCTGGCKFPPVAEAVNDQHRGKGVKDWPVVKGNT